MLKTSNINLGLTRFRRNFYFVRRNIIRTINHDWLDRSRARQSAKKLLLFNCWLKQEFRLRKNRWQIWTDVQKVGMLTFRINVAKNYTQGCPSLYHFITLSHTFHISLIQNPKHFKITDNLIIYLKTFPYLFQRMLFNKQIFFVAMT